MAKKTQNSNNESQKWGVIHIFGYGETQIISDEVNVKFPTLNLQKVQDVIDYIYSLKPTTNEFSKEYYLINIFNNFKVTFISKQESSNNSFELEYSDLDKTSIEALASEMLSIPIANENANVETT